MKALVLFALLLMMVTWIEGTLFPKQRIEVRHIHLEPTGGEWEKHQVRKEVWKKSLTGEWTKELKEEWANVKVPGEKWD